MLDFMDYVQHAFYDLTRWNHDNFYGSLTSTARTLLEFPTPSGLHIGVSSLPSTHFANSYNISALGLVNGSLSFLYSSLALRLPSRSASLPLTRISPGYRMIQDLRRPEEDWLWDIWQGRRQIDRRDTLLYGRLFLPQRSIEALYLRRLSPVRQLKISCVSDATLPNGGTLLATLQNDTGQYTTEYLYSTDSAFLGCRGMYTFGPAPPLHSNSVIFPEDASSAAEDDRPSASTEYIAPYRAPHGRISVGGELYYALLNKSGGMSVGTRFATLPGHGGFPYTMTLTLNPLMGNLSSTYAVQAGRDLAMASRFDFNFYSYESAFAVGWELWRRRGKQEIASNTVKQDGDFPGTNETTTSADAAAMASAQQNGFSEEASELIDEVDDVIGIVKTTVDQNGQIGVLWEGRLRELLFSVGARLDLRQRERIFRTMGVEVQYST